MTYSVLGVEDVGGRRVVDDDDFAELPAESAEVFNIVSPVENAGFPEEPGAEHPPLVQQVGHWVGILKAKKPIRSASPQLCQTDGDERTFARLAVKRTHSKSSPIFWRNSST